VARSGAIARLLVLDRVQILRNTASVREGEQEGQPNRRTLATSHYPFVFLTSPLAVVPPS